MIKLERSHDPGNNGKLISELLKNHLDTKDVVLETESLFSEAVKEYNPVEETPFSTLAVLFKNFKYAIKRIAYSQSALDPVHNYQTIVDKNGNVFPEWMDRLNEEYHHLVEEIEREVNIEDFGAVGDGKTDCTEAFKMALRKGKVKIFIPEGVYITKEIRLPSYTCLVGSGKGKTVLKLHDLSPKGSRLLTNKNHRRGNRNIYVKGMSLDWNVERLGKASKTSTWGNHSSCLLYANVKYGWVRDVEGINPGLHCFDISSTLYNYYGDGYRARGGSEFVWLDHLTGFGFGDDGITTHHSDNIFISNCFMCDPSGKAHKQGFSNSNGIEVDDGSRNVWLWNNSTARCFGGVEIKAHHTSSAANHVFIIGHLSVNDNRSYNFRHIGHHKENDPDSKTAINIRAANIVSVKPIHTALYENSSPRALVVSAYKNVAINNFTVLGDPAYDYNGEPVIAIQYRSRNVVLNNVNVSGFPTAGNDIRVFGGNNHADNIKINNVLAKHSSAKTIHIGNAVKKAEVKKVLAEAIGGKTVVEVASSQIELSDIRGKGFKELVARYDDAETTYV